MPLSSTQATTAGLFGGVARLTPSQVRWSQVRSIGAAWVLTLPSSVALGALFGLLLRVVP
jgi:PiT family inorganic phosphate transporter